MSDRRSVEGKTSTAEESARLAGELALEKKGEEVLLLDLRKFEVGCDYFLIVSGTTDRHVRAIADWIADELARREGSRPWHVEGRGFGHWILLDYVDWVVHVFKRDTRGYYLLERLWGDAPRETLGGAEPADDESDE